METSTIAYILKHRIVRDHATNEVNLSTKNLVAYRYLWGRLPFQEAAALYLMYDAKILHLWRPHYYIDDAKRIREQATLEAFQQLVADIDMDIDVEEDYEPPTPAYSPVLAPEANYDSLYADLVNGV